MSKPLRQVICAHTLSLPKLLKSISVLSKLFDFGLTDRPAGDVSGRS
jgi:hypothetical protein